MKRLTKIFLAAAVLGLSQAAAKAEQIVLQSSQSGMYVTTVNGTLAASTRDKTQAIRFDTVRLNGNKMAFRDIRTGTYLRAGVGPNTFLAVGSPHIRGWETFKVFSMGGGRVALRSLQNGKYVRAGYGRYSHLSASVDERPAGWETFQFVRAPLGNANQGNSETGGLSTRSLAGTYRITHVAADNGFLVRLGRQLSGQARFSLSQRGQVRTTVGCNSISTGLQINNGQVTNNGSVLSTKMWCVDQGQQAAERGIIRALQTSRTVSQDGREVTFRSASGAEVLKITR